MDSPVRPPADSARADRTAAVFSLLVSVVLLIVKFTAYLLTGSAAVFSDALESIVNVLAGGFALYAVILAHRPADVEHPYGHGKVEFLSAGFEGGMMMLAALLMVAEAVGKILHRSPINQVDYGLLLMTFAMLVNGLVGGLLIRQGKASGSIALQADGKHLLSDAVTSVVVLVTLGIIRFTGWWWADAVGAILVAAYIIWMAADLLRGSAAGLMDQQDRSDDAMIRKIIDSHLSPNGTSPRICSYHKLRHRHSGRYHWVDFHIMVPANLSIQEGHKIASTIEYEIELALGEGNATAHVEPCEAKDCVACK